MNENRRIAWLVAALLLLLGAGFYFWLWPQRDAAEAPVAEVAASTAPTTTPEATAAGPEPVPDHYPVPAASDAALPALAESDAPFATALAGLLDAQQIAATLVSEQRIRRLVVTIDNLPRERLALNDRAFQRVPGSLIVHSRDGSYSLSPNNDARYVPLVVMAKTAGAKNVAALYLRFYPLFDQAYRELGVPERHFNDRLVQVIDHLLATPETEGPISLVQPKVFYQFAAPSLESLSAGQKMLIRMGPVNQAQAKAWLRDFRSQIIGTATATP